MKNSIFANDKIRWVFIAAGILIMVVAFMSQRANGLKGIIEPDAMMRLVVAEQLYSTGEWYNHVVPRMNLPQGSDNHWSRLMDMMLVGPAWIGSFFTGFHQSLTLWASYLNGVLLVVTILGGLLALRRYGCGAIAQSALLCGVLCSPPLWMIFQPGQVDNPSVNAAGLVWLLALALPLLQKQRPSARDIALAGCAGAVGLWSSLEFLVPLALLLGWLGIMWLRDGGKPETLERFAHALFLWLIPVFLIEQAPQDWLRVEHDSQSIVHLTLFGLVAFMASIFVLAASRLQSWQRRFIAASFCSVALLLIMQWLFPGVYQGPYAQVDPVMAKIFLSHVNEMKPLHVFLPPSLLLLFFYGVLGVPFIILAAMKDHARRDQYTFLLLLFAGLAILTEMQMRWWKLMVPYGLISIALGLELACLRYRLAPARAFAAMLLVYLIPPLVTLAGSKNPAANWQGIEPECIAAMYESIEGDYFSSVMKTGKPLTVLVPADYGAHVLFWTPHNTLASNYHRDVKGYKAQDDFLTTKDSNVARSVLDKNHVDLISFCLPIKRKGAFVEVLAAGKTAYPWLVELKNPWGGKGLRLFAYRPQ